MAEYFYLILIKVNVNKRRPASSASKTSVPEKKAKLVIPAGQKSGMSFLGFFVSCGTLIFSSVLPAWLNAML